MVGSICSGGEAGSHCYLFIFFNIPDDSNVQPRFRITPLDNPVFLLKISPVQGVFSTDPITRFMVSSVTRYAQSFHQNTSLVQTLSACANPAWHTSPTGALIPSHFNCFLRTRMTAIAWHLPLFFHTYPTQSLPSSSQSNIFNLKIASSHFLTESSLNNFPPRSQFTDSMQMTLPRPTG